MSLVNTGFSANIINLLQDRTLERVFHDALYPNMLYRAEATPDLWEANIGQRMVFTKTGLIAPDTTPLTPGQDPGMATYDTEQWEAEASQYGKAMDTHMPQSAVTLAPTVLRDTKMLGLQSAQTMNRIVRNRLFQAYLGGNTVAMQAAAIGVSQVRVASISGFTETLLNGRNMAVSAINPLTVSFTGGEPDNTVVGAVPDVPSQPFGPGVIALGSPLTVGLLLRAGVFARSRSRIYRVGAGATVDALVAGNVLTLQDIINAVAQMRGQNIPPCSDGWYHVHLTPEGEAQLMADNQFQRIFQSLPGDAPNQYAGIGQLAGCRFYRNTENPNQDNVGTLVDTSGGGGAARSGPVIGGDVINQAGVPIRRELMLGGTAVYEKYIDESNYMSEAGIMGKIGEFTVTNGGVMVMTNRIRYIMRAPVDRLQQIIGQAWSWSGDFPVPSDALTGNAARYKRAIVLEHA